MSAPETADLANFTLLADFGPEDRARLGEWLEECELAAGEELFDEGEPANGLYFVLSGRLRVESTHLGESALFGAGNTLGSFAIVVDGPRETRASAVEDCRLLVLHRSGFRRLVDSDPRLACRLLEAILRESVRLGRKTLAQLQRAEFDRARRSA